MAARAPKTPDGLGPRGKRLWRALHAEDALTGSRVLLAEEACRLADRLEQLDRLLRQDIDVWLTLKTFDNGRPTELIIDKALSEARQQTLALKQILAELSGTAKASGRATGGAPRGGSDEIARRRAARLAAAAGTAQA